MGPINTRKYAGITISYLVAIIGLITLVFPGCAGQSLESERQQESQFIASRVIRDIYYLQDSRTHLCFAYYDSTVGSAGGPSLATVPCEAIPPELLIIANSTDSKK